MKLQTLATGCVTGAVAGLVLLAAFGGYAWQQVSAGVAVLGELGELRSDLVAAGVALDYVTLVRPDPGIAAVTGTDLRGLSLRMAALPFPASGPGAAHLVEMAFLADAVANIQVTSVQYAPDDLREAVLAIATQARIHQSGVTDALAVMLREQREQLLEVLYLALAGFIAATLLLAAMALVGFITVRRRLTGPLRAIEQGLEALGAGDLDSRIVLDREDDFGRLAAAFNTMAAQRQHYERSLREGEARLRQSQRLEAIGQLTGGIAHDFNNLLTVILGNSELLAGELAAQPRLARLAEMASGAAQRGAELTQRLLAFGRRQALEPRSVDIAQLVAALQTLITSSLGERVQVNVVCSDGLWNALVDPAQLENALINLAINARDAMPDGGRLTLELGNARIDEMGAADNPDVLPGEYVMVTVEDTGCGIAPEHLEHVFEPFFSTKEIGKGTGLGLAMVYGFVHQSHGQVKISSVPGEGTRVRIFLPRAPVAPTPHDHTASEGVAAQALPVRGTGALGPGALAG